MNDFPDLPATLDRRSRGLPELPREPVEALITAAAWETAEKICARAKDAVGLHKAVEKKLGAQRHFIIWYDGQDKDPGGRPPKTAFRPEITFFKAEDFGLNDLVVFRWRTKLKDPRKFDETLEAAAERCRKICEAEKGQTDQRGASGTGENEWYTPDEYLKLARDVLGDIDLDPASSEAAQNKVKAPQFFTKADDGLKQEWHGRVWLNPPYAQPFIAEFVSKMIAERKAGRVFAAIMLTHNYTDTSWFHEGASIADAICFTRGRIKFYDEKGNVAAPTQGQAFFYYGDEIDIFADVFGQVGFVVEVRK